jgi:hypothetical protein
MKKNVATNTHKCEHCGRSFVRESTLFTHLCEQKRRWTERDNPANRIAYSAWRQFYIQFQPTSKKKEIKDFIGSAYYGGFTKFGTYCVNVGVINPLNYVEWLLKDGTPLDNWCSDRIYNRYLIEYVRIENHMDAVKRTIEHMLKIAEEQNIQLSDVFRLIHSNKICHMIVNGHISPWVLYNSDGGQLFMSGLNQDQISMIFEYINPDLWNIKFKRHGDEVAEVKTLLKAAKL